MRLRHAWTDARDFALEHPLNPFPLKSALRGYTRESFKADLRAGIDGSLMAVPQGMAFAVVAGLPLYYGITCSVVACIVGALLMSSRHSVYGPTNATAFMVASFFAANPHINQIAAMPMLVFLVGALLVLGAYVRVADLAQYISRTVVVAYLTGAAAQMFAHQLPAVLGMRLAQAEDKTAARTMLTDIWDVLTHLLSAQWPSVLITVLTIAGSPIEDTTVLEPLKKNGLKFSTN